ncbi:hypothetical protein GUY44_26940 [Pimelobacter simplex]|uniref:hypothetical protein n=1 Tax=Nocardioides simplex TaxID=2045 RepID=UPI000535F58B|nr:hypothetical protein [Pimelobacter simplex]MCG8154139.1 hypothetical protein [Pimelobacter simplex]GEB15546.1 hypothetical protein NSI01_38610 [Pimelobacter simplex]
MKVVIFAENLNDSKAIKELILGLRSDLSEGDIEVVRNPPTLTRNAGAAAVKGWAERAAASVEALVAIKGDVGTVLAHTDADAPDDGTFAEQRSADLQRAGLTGAVAVVPVHAIESWWFLYPDATESVVPSWKGALSRTAFNTDSSPTPKADLIRLTKRKQPKRPYQEADSVAVAAAMRAANFAPVGKAKSPSFERFKVIVAAC